MLHLIAEASKATNCDTGIEMGGRGSGEVSRCVRAACLNVASLTSHQVTLMTSLSGRSGRKSVECWLAVIPTLFGAGEGANHIWSASRRQSQILSGNNARHGNDKDKRRLSQWMPILFTWSRIEPTRNSWKQVMQGRPGCRISFISNRY